MAKKFSGDFFRYLTAGLPHDGKIATRTPLFLCACGKLKKESPEFYVDNPITGRKVMGAVCLGCRNDYKDEWLLSCARCDKAVARGKPGFDPKLGFDFKRGGFYHVPLCEACFPAVKLLGEVAAPIIELKIHTCAKQGIKPEHYFQQWWSSLLSQLPQDMRERISPHYGDWITGRSPPQPDLPSKP